MIQASRRLTASNEAQLIDRAVQRIAEGRYKVEVEQDVPVYYFEADVSAMAFMMSLGKMGVTTVVDRPGQVVKVGPDTVISLKTRGGLRLSLQIDKRGFLDVITMSK